MTRYTVVWHQAALDLLAQLWIEAEDRNAVGMAANAVDRSLANDAESKGAPATGAIRQFTVSPLRVLFAVSEPDRLVKVVHVALED